MSRLDRAIVFLVKRMPLRVQYWALHKVAETLLMSSNQEMDHRMSYFISIADAVTILGHNLDFCGCATGSGKHASGIVAYPVVPQPAEAAH